MLRRITLCLALVSAPALAKPEETYCTPPAELLRLVDAPTTPELRIDPSARFLVQATRPAFLTIQDLALPEMKLAGLRFHPGSRASGRDKYYRALEIRPLRQGPARSVRGLPGRPRLTGLHWSGDGQRLAFVHVDPGGSQLWVLEASTGVARRVPGIVLNGTTGFHISWLPDQRSLVVLAVPTKAVAPAPASPVPKGPGIQEHSGGKASARTFQDLLKTPEDEKLFEFYLTSQVVRVTSDGTNRQALTGPGLYTRAEPSPDGQFVLVEQLHRPFSYTLPVSSFPIKTEVLDRQGNAVKVIRDLPLEENSPPDFDAVRPGARHIEWRDDAPASLAWVEALDEGDARKSVEFREQVFLWKPGQEARPWLQLNHRFRGLDWGDGQHALIQEGWHKTRRIRTHWVQPDSPEVPPVTLFDRSSEDRYSDPGSPLHKSLPNGRSPMLMSADRQSIYLSGMGASPEGDRPFLDRFQLDTKKTDRLFRSQAPFFERPVRLLNPESGELITQRESLDSPPNLCLRQQDKVQQVTAFVHPAPQLKGVKKEILRYRRADGVDLTGTLYTPPGYDGKSRLPVLIWAYPGEFKSASAAGQIKDSPYKFIRPFWGGPLFFVMRGYAVLEDPTFPIIGEGTKEPNDTYLEQLVMDAQAAVEAVAAAGVGDPERCAIGGHSYGAFTTANLLAHSDLFRAGIARSGAYNRTLTPFGFQSEERTYWEALDTYTRMSPFTYANKINEPLLMIHGAEDSNPGTFPVQSERLFQAIKGLGGQVRLVMLPKESHSYVARESVLHVFFEMDRWLEKHVKNAPARRKTASKP
jgi:dipeptidyl aminopeptidase/acylaminoacyl peptidase